MSGEWTYLIGLVILGVIMGTAGWIAANKERRLHYARRDEPRGTNNSARCAG